ncbi:Nodule-specific Glycine Rich Peptide [Medicago truncatula]|uniref:Nodule-specific Glycine Rich Peptide n=1 Tax=Medicago truncatula TaxID=3880 RepID=A0A072UW85_MEDTR|nr:Nodule-specific Glycine Rich Peptide [Medicago truncatula]
MKIKYFSFLCICVQLLIVVVAIMPFENGKQCIYKCFRICTIFFFFVYLIRSFCLFAVGETKEPKTNVGVDEYAHTLGISAILQGDGGNKNKGESENVIKFPSGGRWGYGSNVVDFRSGGKGSRSGNIVHFPGGENEGGGGRAGDNG